MRQQSSAFPTAYVQPIHFEDLGGNDFERLVFAYHARTERWITLEWFGQGGKDKGRDIVGVRVADGIANGEAVCVLCANWRKLTLAKIKKDIEKAIKSPSGVPDFVRVVCGHDVPAGLRDKAKQYAQSKGIWKCEVWSGKEFEEFLRAFAESLLLRYFRGELFPDAAAELALFAWGTLPATDHERLALISRAFDRPAFSTPIHQESSIPAFGQAIMDTIEVLKTGIWQTRQGIVIRRLPTKDDLDDKSVLRQVLLDTEGKLLKLRAVYDELIRQRQIMFHGDSPMFEMSPRAAHELDQSREAVLSEFRRAYPQLKLS